MDSSPMTKLLLAVAALLVFAPAAFADVTIEGTGEPAFTKSTTNTTWVRWQGSSAYEAYKVEFDYYDNNVFNPTLTANVSANGSGTMWASWSGVVDTLLEGSLVWDLHVRPV